MLYIWLEREKLKEVKKKLKKREIERIGLKTWRNRCARSYMGKCHVEYEKRMQKKLYKIGYLEKMRRRKLCRRLILKKGSKICKKSVYTLRLMWMKKL